MRVRFYIDPETGRPHIEEHGVGVAECVEALDRATQDFAGSQGARLAYGPTNAGRILKVVYREGDSPNEVFVITAFPLRGKELKAYRRRIRRK